MTEHTEANDDAPIKKTIEYSTGSEPTHLLDLELVAEGHRIGIDASRFDLGLPAEDLTDGDHSRIVGVVDESRGYDVARDLWIETPSGARLHVYPKRGKVERVDDGERVEHDYGDVYDVSTLRNAGLTYEGQEESDDDSDDVATDGGRDAADRFPRENVEFPTDARIWIDASEWYEPDEIGHGTGNIKRVDVVDDRPEAGEILVAFRDVERVVDRRSARATDLEAGEEISISYESVYSDNRIEKTGIVTDVLTSRGALGGSFDGLRVEIDDETEYYVSTLGIVKTRDPSRKIGSDAVVKRVDELEESDDDNGDEPEIVTDGGRELEADHGDGFDVEYVDRETAERCIRALVTDLEYDNLAAAELDARDLLDAITSDDGQEGSDDDRDGGQELVADGGQTVDDVAEGDVIELANGARFRVESIRERYTEPDEYRVAKVGGEKRISWRTHHVETALATGAEIVVDDGELEETGDGWNPEPAELRDGETRESSHAQVARDMLADHHRELIAEGQEESDDDSDDDERADGGQELVSDGGWVSDADTEWCPSCQRERVSCTHLADVAADGGFTTPEPASERMDDNARELAEELADETSLKRREAEVFVLKDRGLSHAEIAEELEIAKSTVDEYSRRINDRIERAENMIHRAGHRGRGTAPDQRPVDDISAIEECSECGDAPAPIILTSGGWECYGCGADV